MTLKAVLFDIDGTLVDSNEAHVVAWAFAFQEAGRPQETDVIRKQIGKGGDLLVPALLPDEPGAAHDQISKAHGRIFADAYLDHVKPFPDAHALVERASRAGLQVVLASSAKGDELDHYVELLDIKSLVTATTSIDDVETSKPAPDIFTTALGKIGIEPEAAIAVGDTPYDVDAAMRSGIVTIGLLSGPFLESELRDAGAIAIYRDVSHLLSEFERSPLGRKD